MFSCLYNLKFRNQIVIIFSGILLIICMISGLTFYYFSSQNIKENFTKSAEDAVIQTEDTLETRIGFVEGKCESMLINQTFYNTVFQYVDNYNVNNVAASMGIIDGYLKDFEYGDSLISSSYLYTDYGEFYSYLHSRNPDFDFKQSLFYKQYTDNQAVFEQWMTPMDDRIFRGGTRVIPCIRRFATGTGRDKWIYFVYQLNQKKLEELVTGENNFFDEIIILNQEGKVILGGEKISSQEIVEIWQDPEKKRNLEQGEIKLDGNSYLAETCNIDSNGWTLIALKSQQELLKSLYDLAAYIVLAAVVVLAAGILLMVWISRRLTDGLSRLEKHMYYVQRGELNIHFIYPYSNEIGNLSKAFNYMLDELQNVIQKKEYAIQELQTERNRVEEVQKQKRKAELKALQAQINPHLLYNTLNAITWETAENGMTDASILASSLGSFFRLSLSKGAEIISVGEETEHVKSYLSIQGIRYKDKLKYEIQIPGCLKEYRIIKLVLQPLVENSIYHGIKEKKTGGMICVRAEKKRLDSRETIEFEVWDNGAGIASEKLNNINDSLRKGKGGAGKGYGIYNVNERILIYYGQPFGLHYESIEGEFTRAVLRIPAIREDEYV